MVFRVDIVVVECGTMLDWVIDIMIAVGYSCFFVYREVLDDAIGMVHVKDLIFWFSKWDAFEFVKVV